MLGDANVDSNTSGSNSKTDSPDSPSSSIIINATQHRTQIPITNFLTPTIAAFVPRYFRVGPADLPSTSPQYPSNDVFSLIQLHTLLGFPDTEPNSPPFSKLVSVGPSTKRRNF